MHILLLTHTYMTGVKRFIAPAPVSLKEVSHGNKVFLEKREKKSKLLYMELTKLNLGKFSIIWHPGLVIAK